MPNRDLNTTLSKFAAGNLAGYKGAQPNRFPRMTVLPAAAPDTSPNVSDCLPHAVSLTESFNTADGPLGPDLDWVYPHFTSGQLVVVSNHAQQQTVNNAGLMVVNELLDLDQAVQVTVVAFSGAAFNTSIGLCVRVPNLTGTGNSAEFSVVTAAGATAQYQVTHGPAVTAARPVPGDVLRLEVSGDTLVGMLNGVAMSTGTFTPIPPPPAGSYAGFFLNLVGADLTVGTVDNFQLAGTTFCP